MPNQSAPTLFSKIVERARRHLLEALALLQPIPPLVGQGGTPGGATVTYKVVATNATGHSPASQAATTTTANATLNGTNYNILNWVAVPRASGYQIYRTVGGPSQGLIASVASSVLTLNDTGLAGDASTPPTTNTSGTVGTSQFWSDDELVDHALAGARDLWRAIVNLNQEHFSTILEDGSLTTVPSTSANPDQLAGVPTDVFRILLIEPLDTTDTGNYNSIKFRPALYKSAEFRRRRSEGVLDSTGGGVILFDILQQGSPIAAPQIRIAPKVDATIPLRMQYVPTLDPTLNSTSNNPIPGESDWALVCWIVAHASAKERPDRQPDPTWLGLYGTEKTNILVALPPRQEQEPLVVPGIFDDEYENY